MPRKRKVIDFMDFKQLFEEAEKNTFKDQKNYCMSYGFTEEQAEWLLSECSLRNRDSVCYNLYKILKTKDLI